MSTQEQRERFEAAQRPRTDLAKNRRGDYTNPVVQHCWRTWQTAEAAAIERCAKFMEARADEIAAAENCAANMMAMIYRDEAKSLRALLPKEES